MERKIVMNYTKPDMQILIWEDDMLPITQVSGQISEGDSFVGDIDEDGLLPEE